MAMGRGRLVFCKDGLSCVASVKTSPLSPSFSLLLSLQASHPPRGIFFLTGVSVKFDCFSSCFDAVTSHPLKEIKAIKLFQMSRHRHREINWAVRPGASYLSPCPTPNILSYMVMMRCKQSCAFYKLWRLTVYTGLSETAVYCAADAGFDRNYVYFIASLFA